MTYTVTIPNWHVGMPLTIRNLVALSFEGALEVAVDWVNRYAGHHYCDELPDGTTACLDEGAES